jgi:hypothetical protein
MAERTINTSAYDDAVLAGIVVVINDQRAALGQPAVTEDEAIEMFFSQRMQEVGNRALNERATDVAAAYVLADESTRDLVDTALSGIDISPIKGIV